MSTYSSEELDLILSLSAFSHGCKGARSDSAGSAPLVDISIQLIHGHTAGRIPQHVSVKPVCLRSARRPAEECVSASVGTVQRRNSGHRGSLSSTSPTMPIDTAVKARIFKQLVTEWSLARGGEAAFPPPYLPSSMLRWNFQQETHRRCHFH